MLQDIYFPKVFKYRKYVGGSELTKTSGMWLLLNIQTAVNVVKTVCLYIFLTLPFAYG